MGIILSKIKIMKLKELLICSILLFSINCTGQLTKISMAGLSINDSKKKLKNIKLPVIVSGADMITYKTKNKNELYISFADDKIVAMENRQGNDKLKTKTLLFDNFIFGKTTLKEIKDQFGSYGYRYKNNPFLDLGSIIYNFNCYEFDSQNDEILIIVTIIILKKQKIDVLDENNSVKLTLYNVTLAEKTNLEKIWGKEKCLVKTIGKLSHDIVYLELKILHPPALSLHSLLHSFAPFHSYATHAYEPYNDCFQLYFFDFQINHYL